MTMQHVTRIIPAAFLLAVAGLLILIILLSPGAQGERGGECNESGDHEVSDWIRVHATPADPMPLDRYEVVASVEVFENGSWGKEWNSTMGELVSKPDSPSPQVIDRQNGSEEGIRLHASETRTYRVWAGVCRNNQSYWNYTEVTILQRNRLPVPIAQLSTENGTAWTTFLEVSIDPGEEMTVFFNGSLSNDPDGDELDHFWDIDGKGAIDDLTGPWVNWTFSEAGFYPIFLTVGDGNETAKARVKLLIHYAIFPDLNVTTPPFTSAEEIMTGEPLNITARIQNQGDNVTGDFKVFVYTHNLDTLNSRLINKVSVPSMDVNEFYTLSFAWTTTHLVEAGSHVIRVDADAENTVMEKNESNNQAWSQPFQINTDHQPFIIIKDMSVSNATPMLFELVNITLTIGNTGTGAGELLTIFLLVNGEEYDIRYLPLIEPESQEVLVLKYYTDLKGSYNLTCEVYDNGMLQDAQGTRIVIQDLPKPPITDKNETDPREDNENLDWLMMGAGIFMIIMAVAIQLVGHKAREK